MTDFALSAPDQATMYQAFAAVGIVGGGEVRTQGTLPDGTEWAMLDWGARRYETGETIEGEDGEEIALSESDGLYWVVLRWNGAAPTPDLPPGITIAWRSDDAEAGPYPAGLPMFA